jgi:hypothetical protein
MGCLGTCATSAALRTSVTYGGCLTADFQILCRIASHNSILRSLSFELRSAVKIKHRHKRFIVQ